MFENLFVQAGLSLERLKTFSDIVNSGGIAAAAGDDANRQSQFSRQLKELERYFGVELIRRRRGALDLTDAGRRLYGLICHTFGALEEFRYGCANQPIELSVGAGESLIQWLVLPRLPALTASHPSLSLRLRNLRTDEICKGVREGTVDFGIISRFENQDDLCKASIGRMEFRLFVPRRLMPKRRKLQHASEILGLVPLAMLESSPTVRQAVEREAQRRGFKIENRLLFSSYPQLAQAVKCLQVAAIMPAFASQTMDAEQVTTIRIPFLDEMTREICLIWSRKAAEIRPAIATYARVLPQKLRQTRND